MEYIPQWVIDLGRFVPDIPEDTVVPLIVFAVFAVFIFRNGIRSAVALFFATYAAILLYLFFPYVDNFQRLIQEATTDAPIIHALLFGGLIAASYLIVRKPITADVPWFGLRRFVLTGTLAGIQTGLIIALAHHLIPIESLISAPAAFSDFFVTEFTLFWWLVAPLAAILVLTRRTL